MSTEDDRPLMTSADVAALFRVEPKTVTRWAREGKLPSIPTPGGHPRFIESEIRALVDRARGVTPEELHRGRCAICMMPIGPDDLTRPAARGSGLAHAACPG